MGDSAILLAERDVMLCAEVRAALLPRTHSVIEATCTRDLVHEVRVNRDLDLLIINSRLQSGNDGLEAVSFARALRPDLPIILIASESSEELAILALRAGCTDYQRCPVRIEDLLASVERLLPVAKCEPSGADEMIGDSPEMTAVRAYLCKLAFTDTRTLITGETGTGKELAAEMIHRRSARRNKPFICINCAAIPDGLIESELFGYDRGAFTGAQGARDGTLKQADGGTVFFDEIGDMSPYGQAKVLRALEAQSARPLGGKREVAFDIRVIAATNRNLEQLIAEQKFRADLFFRLNVANVYLPPLRNRKEDLVPLSRHYFAKMKRRDGCMVEGFSTETYEALLRYDWPGNVRELKNLIEAVFVEPPPKWISFADLPISFRTRCETNANLSDNERDRVLSALVATNWNKSLAAQKLHWSRMTLYRKMSRYQVVNEASIRRDRDKGS